MARSRPSFPTIKDVASRAGVSVTSVSHAFSGARHVNPNTVALIWQAATELGYRPSRIAAGLRRGRTSNIGLILPDMSNLGYTALARAVHNAAHARDYQVLIRNVDESLAQEAEAVHSLLGERTVDGIVVVPTHGPHAYLQELIDRGAAVVVVNRQLADVDAPTVLGDDAEHSFLATRHLLTLGHRRLAAIAGPVGISTADQRVAGFRRALAERNLSLDFVRRCPGIAGSAPRQEARAAVLDLLRLQPPPTAIFVTSHQLLEGAVIALRELAVRCPEDVALVAFGSSWAAQTMTPVVTVVEQDAPAIAQTAVDLLTTWISTGNPPFRQTVVPPRFVLGASCGWLRRPSAGGWTPFAPLPPSAPTMVPEAASVVVQALAPVPAGRGPSDVGLDPGRGRRVVKEEIEV